MSEQGTNRKLSSIVFLPYKELSFHCSGVVLVLNSPSEGNVSTVLYDDENHDYEQVVASYES